MSRDIRQSYLFAPRLYRGNCGQIWRNFVGQECFDFHFDQANKRTTVIRALPTASVDDDTDAGHLAAASADDTDGFLDPAAARHDVLSHDEPLVRPNLETTPQNQTAFVFLGKDVAFPKGAADFLAHDDPAESRGDDGVAFDVAEFISQSSANVSRDVCMLKKQRTLEELPAMQAGAQDKMTVKERPGFSKEREQILAH